MIINGVGKILPQRIYFVRIFLDKNRIKLVKEHKNSSNIVQQTPSKSTCTGPSEAQLDSEKVGLTKNRKIKVVFLKEF